MESKYKARKRGRERSECGSVRACKNCEEVVCESSAVEERRSERSSTISWEVKFSLEDVDFLEKTIVNKEKKPEVTQTNCILYRI